ncbi:hypothetical protein ACJX0J_028309 [Zea mays]
MNEDALKFEFREYTVEGINLHLNLPQPMLTAFRFHSADRLLEQTAGSLAYLIYNVKTSQKKFQISGYFFASQYDFYRIKMARVIKIKHFTCCMEKSHFFTINYIVLFMKVP